MPKCLSLFMPRDFWVSVAVQYFPACLKEEHLIKCQHFYICVICHGQEWIYGGNNIFSHWLPNRHLEYLHYCLYFFVCLNNQTHCHAYIDAGMIFPNILTSSYHSRYFVWTGILLPNVVHWCLLYGYSFHVWSTVDTVTLLTSKLPLSCLSPTPIDLHTMAYMGLRVLDADHHYSPE